MAKRDELTSIPDQAAVAEVEAVVEKGRGKKPSPSSKAPNFSPKEKKFLKGYVEEVIPGKKTQRALAMEIYDAKDEKSADVIASTNLSKVKFKDALAAAFAEADITPTSLAQVLQEAMQARKTTQFAGEIFESDVPDHSIRVNAARAAAALMKEDDSGEKSGGLTLNFNTGTQNFVQKAEIKPQE